MTRRGAGSPLHPLPPFHSLDICPPLEPPSPAHPGERASLTERKGWVSWPRSALCFPAQWEIQSPRHEEQGEAGGGRWAVGGGPLPGCREQQPQVSRAALGVGNGGQTVCATGTPAPRREKERSDARSLASTGQGRSPRPTVAPLPGLPERNAPPHRRPPPPAPPAAAARPGL